MLPIGDSQDYLRYGADDVSITHPVYTKVLPKFFESCPTLVSFSSVLTMGLSFLPGLLPHIPHVHHVSLASLVLARFSFTLANMVDAPYIAWHGIQLTPDSWTFIASSPSQ